MAEHSDRGETPVFQGESGSLPWPRLADALLLFALPLLIYTGSYHYDLLGLDDETYYVVNQDLHKEGWVGLADVWKRPYYSEYFPVTQTTFWLDLKLFGKEDWTGARIHQVLWFALGAVLVQLVFLRLTRRRGLALCIALFYVLHPLGVHSVVWLANRKTAVCLAFAFWSLERYIAARQAPGLKAAWPAYGASCLCAILAILSKPHGVAVPCMLAAYELTLGEGAWKRRVLGLLPFAAFSAGFVFWTLSQDFRSDLKLPLLGGSRAASLFTDGPIFLRYLQRVALPVNLSFFYVVHEFPAWSLWKAAAWIFFLGLLAASVWKSRFPRLVAFGWLLGLAAMSPAVNFMPQPVPMSDHYVQWALPGWLLALVLIVEDRLPGSFAMLGLRRAGLLAGAVCLGLGTLTLARVPYFVDGLTVFGHATQAQPESTLAWSNYMVWLQRNPDPSLRNKTGEAGLRALRCPDVSRLPPTYRSVAVREAALLYHRAGKTTDGWEMADRELALLDDPVLPHLTKAEIAFRTGAALQGLRMLEPFFTEGHAIAAGVLRERCRSGQVLPDAMPKQLGIEIQHGDEYDFLSAHNTTARILMIAAAACLAEGEYERAFDYAALNLNMHPTHKGARLIMAEVYRKLGLPQASEQVLVPVAEGKARPNR